MAASEASDERHNCMVTSFEIAGYGEKEVVERFGDIRPGASACTPGAGGLLIADLFKSGILDWIVDVPTAFMALGFLIEYRNE